MLSLIALAMAATSPSLTTPSPEASPLLATSPWWERVTRTISSDGTEQSCRYESSLGQISEPECEASGEAGKPASRFTKLTYERRFAPGAPDMGKLQPGDKLLGSQVMMININSAGAVDGCKVVVTSGDSLPAYGCDEAKAEKFLTGAEVGEEAGRWAYMTILVYGHVEQIA